MEIIVFDAFEAHSTLRCDTMIIFEVCDACHNYYWSENENFQKNELY